MHVQHKKYFVKLNEKNALKDLKHKNWGAVGAYALTWILTNSHLGLTSHLLADYSILVEQNNLKLLYHVCFSSLGSTNWPQSGDPYWFYIQLALL